MYELAAVANASQHSVATAESMGGILNPTSDDDAIDTELETKRQPQRPFPLWEKGRVRTLFIRVSAKLLRHDADHFQHLVGVAPLVVVPTDDLRKVGIQDDSRL